MGSFRTFEHSVEANENNDNESTVIKRINDEGTFTYIIQRNNEFQYLLERMPPGDNNMNGSSQCSLKTSSLSSNTSIPSASNWRSEEKIMFNLNFHSERSENSTVATEFLSFFEKSVPNEVPFHLKDLTEMNWYDPFNDNADPIHKKLVNQSAQFQLLQSDAASEDFVKTIIEIFEFCPVPKVKLRFGVVDIVLTETVQGLPFMFCAFEIKGAAPYDIYYRDKCRIQLAAYLISMALDNDKKLQLVHQRRFGCQRLYGVLNIGLTPIFYKTDIEDSYIDAISDNSWKNIPQLMIKEFTPIEPYNDREFLNHWSRPILIKSFDALLRKHH
ncbi:hypothetical protein HA402_001863 [Bradysia odoriphaga]|nr:hypothetical protein HA402_001863 [Bradysia odoriphaga]